MNNNLRDLDVKKLLPNSLHKDKFTIALLRAFYEEVLSILDKTEENLLSFPDSLLDLLAFEKHVDFYDPSLPIEQKRQLIDRSRFFHRQKGTPAAVEDLIITLFGEGKVVEWFEYDGQPYHFKVVTNNRSVTQEKAQEFIKALNSVKRLTAILDKVELTQTEDMNIYFAGVLHTGDQITIRQVN